MGSIQRLTTMKSQRRRRVPSLWWDFAYEGSATFVVVETDDPKHKIIGKWRVPDTGQPGLVSGKQVKAAQKLMDDINDGRLSFDEVGKAFRDEQHRSRSNR